MVLRLWSHERRRGEVSSTLQLTGRPIDSFIDRWRPGGRGERGSRSLRSSASPPFDGFALSSVNQNFDPKMA
jgi:hypothetical protein